MALGDAFTLGAGAVSDIFAAKSQRLKAKGDRLEAENYYMGADLADKNLAYTKESTAIKEAQAGREIYKTIGAQQAQVGGAGLASSGNAVDLLRESAQQGALHQAVLSQQGLIAEEGYKEQGSAFRNMGQAALFAAEADENAAKGLEKTSRLKFFGAGLSLFSGGLLGGSSSGGGDYKPPPTG